MDYSYTVIDGERVEVNVAAAYRALKAAFEAAFPGVRLIISSGTRTRAEQQYLYDGWSKRLPGFNLAVAPGFSNHEEDGPVGPRALDLRDSGGDAGVASRGSARDRWMQDNAARFGFSNAGYGFRPVEAWHKEFTGVIGGGSPAGGTEEDDMFTEDDRKALEAVKAALLNGRPDIGMDKKPIDSIIVGIRKLDDLLRVPGQDFGWPQHTYNAAQAILLALGQGAGGAPVDVQALAKAVRDGLGADVASELAKRLAS